jgi:hypothetical protein
MVSMFEGTPHVRPAGSTPRETRPPAKRGSGGLGLLAAIVVGLASMGCVSAEQHRDALADLQRLRMEAWQRSVEASSLRLALDRTAAENAQLRAYAQAPSPVMAALASRVEEVARKQDAMLEEVRAVQVCPPAPAGSAAAGGSAQAAQQPKGRKVTDLLYSRF